MSFDHDMQMKVKDEVITDLESQLKEANEKLMKAWNGSVLKQYNEDKEEALSKLKVSEKKISELRSINQSEALLNTSLHRDRLKLEHQLKEANEKLAEKDKVIMSQEKERQSTELFWKLKLEQLEQRLQETEEVVRFYGDHSNWLYNQIAKTKDVSLITSGIPKGLEFESGGKRARAYLAKHEAIQEAK